MGLCLESVFPWSGMVLNFSFFYGELRRGTETKKQLHGVS